MNNFFFILLVSCLSLRIDLALWGKRETDTDYSNRYNFDSGINEINVGYSVGSAFSWMDNDYFTFQVTFVQEFNDLIDISDDKNEVDIKLIDDNESIIASALGKLQQINENYARCLTGELPLCTPATSIPPGGYNLEITATLWNGDNEYNWAKLIRINVYGIWIEYTETESDDTTCPICADYSGDIYDYTERYDMCFGGYWCPHHSKKPNYLGIIIGSLGGLCVLGYMVIAGISHLLLFPTFYY